MQPARQPAPTIPNLDAGSVASTLRMLPAGAQTSELWRSAAAVLLRLNTRECDAIALLFEDERASDEMRILVLDLLAAAGTFEAQIVMRRLLALAVARRDLRMFATFVQRLGIVECPDGPTLRFLMSVYAETRLDPHDIHASCAYALGAAAGQAYGSGEPDAAIRATEVLRRDLVGAVAPAEKCALLTALGNAGISTDVMVISRFTNDVDPQVRCAAALALRKMATSDARTALVGLASDADLKVADSALRALAEQKLDDDELERLAELVLGGRTAMVLDARILRFLTAQRPRLSACPGRAGAIENAIRLLVGRVESGASGERRMPSNASHPAMAARPQTPPPGRAMQNLPLPCSGAYRMVRPDPTRR